MSATLRDATPGDVPQLHAIYSHAVLTGLGTFEEVPPELGEFERRFRTIASHALPWLVADDDGEIAGYAYVSPFRPRTGYRYSLEDSVYVRADRRGAGIGSLLLPALVDRCEAKGAHQLMAIIGDSGNAGSIAIHARAGFAHVGIMRGVGFKFGRWVDVVVMQRALNGGAGTDPKNPGAWR